MEGVTKEVQFTSLEVRSVGSSHPWLVYIGSCPSVSQLNAAFPFSCRGHGAPSLSLLQILSVNIHPKTEALWEKEIPPLLSVLEGMEIS